MPPEAEVTAPAPLPGDSAAPRPGARRSPDATAVLLCAMAAGVLATALAVTLVAASTSPSEDAERAAFLAAAAASALALLAVVASKRAPGPRAARAGLGVVLGVAAGLAAGRLADAPAATAAILVVAGAVAGGVAAPRLPDRALGPVSVLIVLGGVAAFWPPEAPLSAVEVAAGIAAAVLGAWIVASGAVARLAGRTPLRAALDAIAVLGFLLVIGDSLFVPDNAISDHMGFYLGPVNDVLHGRPMLVDTWSQYGNGVMYALVPWFALAPIGYGTFSILTTAATALQYLIVYAVLRLTLRSQLVAIATVAVAVAVILFAGLGDYANYPSIGVLRFGPPYVVLLLGILAVRARRGRTALVAAAAVVVAVAVTWSAETGATTVAVAAAMLAVEGLSAPGGFARRLRGLLLRGALLAGVCVAGVALFSLATYLGARAWPDWGPYLDYLRLYTTQGFGTLPVVDWSPGLVVGAIYAVSAVMAGALALLRADLVRERPEAPLACAGLAALGAVSYTYFLGRSHPNNVMHVCLPAFMLLALWLDGRGVAVVTGRGGSRRWAAALLAGLAAVAFVASVPSIRDKWPRTVFAAVVPLGGAGETQQSLSLRVRDLWSNPPVDPLAPAAEAFVRRYGAGRPAVVVLRPPLFAETLLRVGRSDAMPIANPSQDSLSPASEARVQAAVDTLRPGARLFAVTDPAAAIVEDDLVQLQLAELEFLDERFEWRLIARDAATGLTSFELVART